MDKTKHESFVQRHQVIRYNLERYQMPVGFRSQDVTGSGIFLGAALDGLLE